MHDYQNLKNPILGEYKFLPNMIGLTDFGNFSISVTYISSALGVLESNGLAIETKQKLNIKKQNIGIL